MKLAAVFVKMVFVYSEKSAIGRNLTFYLIFIHNELLNTSTRLYIVGHFLKLYIGNTA
jgi:hypothetical protein